MSATPPRPAHLRPVRDSDRPFLLALFGESRSAEIAHAGWDEATSAAFVEHQFAAQDDHYRRNYPGATLDVVELDGEPAGRLYVHRGPRDIRIMDILLAPGFRGRGVGAALLRGLIAEATASGRVLSIHVERDNPARRLYERLGFTAVGEHGVHLLLQRTPDAVS